MPVIFRDPAGASTACGRRRTSCLPVEITSAIELDESTVQEPRQEDRRAAPGARCELTTQVEPDILGGIVVRVGNSILDASIRNRLEQLRKQVASGSA